MNWLLWGGPIAICGLLSLREAQGSEPVATIDTYGLARVCRAEVLKAAGISVGSPVPDPMESRRIEERLKGLAGVEDARVAVVHVRRQSAAENSPPQPTVYIGIREVGRPVVQFRPAPTAKLSFQRT